MKRETRAFFGLLGLDALCTYTAVLGSALVALPLLAFPLPVFWTVLLCGAAVAIFALSAVKPWLPGALLAGGAGLPLLVLSLLGRGEETFAYLAGLFPWAFAGLPEDPLYPPLPSLLLAVFLLLLPVALVFWLLYRVVRSLWVLTAVCGGVAVAGAFLCQEEPLAAFLLLCGGILVFLPAVRVAPENRLRARGIALLFTLPILGLSLLFGPKADDQWYSAGVRHLVGDVQDLWDYHFGPVQGFPGLSMRGMGLMPLGSRLGGDLELGSATVFLVDSETPVALRGQALDYYTGQSWQDTPGVNQGGFRLKSLFFGEQRTQAYSQDRPLRVPDTAVGLFAPVEGRIVIRANFASLFLPYRTETVTLEGNLQEDVYFNLQGETWMRRQPDSGYEISVEAEPWNYLSPAFDRNLLGVLASAPRSEDPYWEEAAATCLQVPDTVPDWVRQLAEELTAGETLPYRKAIALRDYLTESCTYTTTPGEPDPEVDFVADFLTKKQGYCTYFASALTVLCRLAGVPARYVTGYAAYYDAALGRCRATQETAHAWTEVYLSNVGWVPVDALSRRVYRIPDHIERIPVEATPRPSAAATPTPEPEVLLDDPLAGGSWSPMQLLYLLLLIPIGGIFLLGARWYPRKYAPERVRARHPEPAAAAEFYYHALLRQLQLLDVVPQSGETLTAFLRRAAACLPDAYAQPLAQAAETMNRLRFGEVPPEEAEVRGMGETVVSLEAYLRREWGLMGYVLKAFFGTVFLDRSRSDG